jgi:hypothetical protein
MIQQDIKYGYSYKQRVGGSIPSTPTVKKAVIPDLIKGYGFLICIDGLIFTHILILKFAVAVFVASQLNKQGAFI